MLGLIRVATADTLTGGPAKAQVGVALAIELQTGRPLAATTTLHIILLLVLVVLGRFSFLQRLGFVFVFDRAMICFLGLESLCSRGPSRSQSRRAAIQVFALAGFGLCGFGIVGWRLVDGDDFFTEFCLFDEVFGDFFSDSPERAILDVKFCWTRPCAGQRGDIHFI